MLAVEEAQLLDQAPVVQVGLEVVERVEMVHLGVRRVIRALLGALIQGEVVVDLA